MYNRFKRNNSKWIIRLLYYLHMERMYREIKALDDALNEAVNKINELDTENRELKEENKKLKERIKELEATNKKRTVDNWATFK